MGQETAGLLTLLGIIVFFIFSIRIIILSTYPELRKNHRGRITPEQTTAPADAGLTAAVAVTVASASAPAATPAATVLAVPFPLERQPPELPDPQGPVWVHRLRITAGGPFAERFYRKEKWRTLHR